MAGRKKLGDLQGPIGVRLDRNIEALVRKLAAESVVCGGEAGRAIRIIVFDWLATYPHPGFRLEQAAKREHESRRQYSAGVGVGGSLEAAKVDEKAPKGKRSRGARGAEKGAQ